jgi:hypothetical protein
MDYRTLPRRAIASEIFWLAVYIVTALVATGICLERRCNNFLIFRSAFEHLAAGSNLYASYPAEHADLFKYSPTFALLFAPFARLPFSLALLFWNFLNVLLIFLAIRLALPPDRRLAALQLAGLGLITTVDGSQSNGLIAALIVFAFVALERGRLTSAAFAIAAGVLIKLFPLAAAAFALPRRDRWRFAALGCVIGLLLIAAPLAVTDPHTLSAQYRWWYAMGSADALDRGVSAMRLLHLAVGYDGPNWPIQLAGTVLLLFPLVVQRNRWSDPDFRRRFLASLLVYTVIFNHKAEQPSFVIAVVGVAIWYAVTPRTPIRTLLTGSTFVATVPILIAVAAPGAFATGVDGPLLAASACCTVVWLTMQGELLELFPERSTALGAEFGGVTDEAAV